MTAQDRKTPNYGRRILWLAAFVVILFGGYSAGWFYLADQLVTRAKAMIAAATRDGVTVECANPIAHGFPFRLGVYCDRVAYANAAEAMGMTAGNLRTAGQIYDPMCFVADLDGPAMVATPRNGSLKIDWEKLRASVRWARPLPERVSVEGGGVDTHASWTTRSGPPVAYTRPVHERRAASTGLGAWPSRRRDEELNVIRAAIWPARERERRRGQLAHLPAPSSTCICTRRAGQSQLSV